MVGLRQDLLNIWEYPGKFPNSSWFSMLVGKQERVFWAVWVVIPAINN